MSEINTRVDIGALHMKNPVMPASGTYDYFENGAGLYPESELGAIMLKSVHYNQRPGNRPPRIMEVCGGMLNAVGIPSEGIDAFMAADRLSRYRQLNVPMVVSISANSAEDLAYCLRLLEGREEVAAVELNLSCPNVGTGLQLSSDEKVLAEVMTASRKATTHTLIAKLSPNVTDIRLTARICEETGADAVTIANTYMAMAIDIKSRKPYLGNGQGGLSGPAIKPLTMYRVYQAYQAVRIPIIACGGIMCAEDAIEYILAGAEAVQVGAGNFADPLLMPKVIHGIETYMRDNNFASLADFRGAAVKR